MRGWELTADRILVRKIEETTEGGLVLAPKDGHSVDAVNGDYRRTILKGEVLAVGPGKWIEGEWWWLKDGEPINGVQPYGWNWIPSYRQMPDVRPGQIVMFGDWNDLPELEEGHALIQEADILCVVN